MKIIIGSWEQLCVQVQLICFEVFVDEQKVFVEIELDEMDLYCVYVVVYDDVGQLLVIGCLLLDGYIGCMVVCKGGCG